MSVFDRRRKMYIKIKKAKEIIIANMAEPPGLEELADQVGLNLKKTQKWVLQATSIYGDTVYGFLFDYQMDYARRFSYWIRGFYL